MLNFIPQMGAKLKVHQKKKTENYVKCFNNFTSVWESIFPPVISCLKPQRLLTFAHCCTLMPAAITTYTHIQKYIFLLTSSVCQVQVCGCADFISWHWLCDWLTNWLTALTDRQHRIAWQARVRHELPHAFHWHCGN